MMKLMKAFFNLSTSDGSNCKAIETLGAFEEAGTRFHGGYNER
jgi:hypothetical protein